MNFTFTRVPSVKVGVAVSSTSLVAADNTLVLIGRMAASGSSATARVPYTVQNFGDPVAAAAECLTQFGAGSEIGEMVVAAINGVAFSDLDNKLFPTLVCIPMANGSTDLAGALAQNQGIPMPFVAVPFELSNATQMGALKSHLQLISGSDRGANGQFGSFGFMADDEDVSAVTAAGTAAASELIMGVSLRDLAGSKANKLHQVASAYAAVCASAGVPFLPLNGIKVGGLVAPASSSDWHTAGDAGTAKLCLDAGVGPLMVSPDGSIRIMRTVTSHQTVAGTPDSSYFDMQDFQGLYYLRKNCYSLAQQPRYRRAKASDKKLLALKSEIIVNVLKPCEALEICQYVDKLVSLFTVTRDPSNRSAAVYNVPVNIIPGFHNKGIGLTGTTQFDSFTL